MHIAYELVLLFQQLHALNYNLVRALVVLVQAPVVHVQVLVDLVQAHLPQGGLISVVSRSWLYLGRRGEITTLTFMLHQGHNSGG